MSRAASKVYHLCTELELLLKQEGCPRLEGEP